MICAMLELEIFLGFFRSPCAVYFVSFVDTMGREKATSLGLLCRFLQTFWLRFPFSLYSVVRVAGLRSALLIMILCWCFLGSTSQEHIGGVKCARTQIVWKTEGYIMHGK